MARNQTTALAGASQAPRGEGRRGPSSFAEAIVLGCGRSNYVPHKPHPKQAEFLALEQDEAFYGGAGGGGKSDALLMSALKYVHVPGYASLLLRRQYKHLTLPEGLIPRSHEWLDGTDAHWDGDLYQWRFPSNATLTFGYLDTERDKDRYQGSAYQFIGFDELTQFPERWYLYLFSRLRRLVGSDVPTRQRGAGNPGGIGHEWVFRRFVKSPDRGRPFIAARIEDNPSLDEVDYRRNLSKLDSVTRKQLEEGVWVADSSGLVYPFGDINITTKLPDGEWSYLLGLDFGVTDATAFVVLGWRRNDPTVYVVEAYGQSGLAPSEAAREVERLEAVYKFVRIVGDVGGLGKAFAQEATRRFSIPIEPAEKNNKRGYQKLFAGDLERGRIRVLETRGAELLDEWRELPWTEDRTKEVDGFDNHRADACLYAWRASSAFHEREAPGEKSEAERREAERLAAKDAAFERVRRQQNPRLPATHRLRRMG